jgi:hypothetical protein
MHLELHGSTFSLTFKNGGGDESEKKEIENQQKIFVYAAIHTIRNYNCTQYS